MDCELCKRDNIRMTASSYCSECEERMCRDCSKHHRRSKSTMKHTLLDVKASDQNSQITRQLRELTTDCVKHQHRVFEYICVPHNTLCCIYCVTESHRKCESVVTLDDYKTSTEYKKEVSEGESSRTYVCNAAACLTARCNEFDEFMTRKDEITKGWLEKLLSHISTKASTIIERKKQECISSMVDYKELVKKTLVAMDEIKMADTMALLAVAEEYGSTEQSVVAVREVNSRLERQKTEINKGLELTRRLKVLEVDVKIEPILKAIEENLTVTEIGTAHCEVLFPGAVHGGLSPPPRRCIFIEDHVLLVCTYPDNTASAVNISIGEQTAKVKFTSKPFGLASAGKSRALVTLPFQKKIVQVTLQPSDLKTNYIDTNTAFYCIAPCNRTSFITTSKETGKMYIINWNGAQLKEIAVLTAKELIGCEAFRQSILSYVDDIVVNERNNLVFASSPKMKRVFAVTFDGELKLTYNQTAIDIPMGLSVGPNSRILVCSYGNHQVIELKPDDATYCRTVLSKKDGLAGPLDISYNTASNEMVVCEDAKGREVKTFKVL